MEEYLLHMKTLRSQINDVEDQAAKISAEEQIQLTTIQTLQNDLLSAKSDTKQLREDIAMMLKAMGQICSLISGKQRKIGSLEFDSLTHTQTLELIQQERISLSSKLMEKRTYYSKVADALSTKLMEQENWVKSQKLEQIKEPGLVNNKLDEQMTVSKDKFSPENHHLKDNVSNDAEKDLFVKLDLANAKLDGIVQMKAKLVTDNAKIKESLKQAKSRSNNFKTELLALSVMTLEEEHKAVVSDINGETQYLHSLQDQVEQIKGISHVVKCGCGEKYRVCLSK